MHQECRLSIITVNYNGFNDTCALIDTITFTDDMEVIVVDNGSTKDEAALIRQQYPQVIAIRSEENLGFAGGNNLGIRGAKGKYLYLINNDTLLYSGKRSEINDEYFFQPLIDRLESDCRIGVVCPKIRFTWSPQPIQFACYTPLSTITLRNHAIGYGEEDKGQYDKAHPTPYAHGAAMVVRREAIDHVGLLPECYFLYYEELDWSMMFTRAGYQIWYEPASVIYHKESQATGADSPLKTYYVTRNRFLLARRNSQPIQRYATYAYLFAVVGIRDIVKHTLNRRTDLVKATLCGICHFCIKHDGKK